MTLGTNGKKLLAAHVGCLHNDYDSLILHRYKITKYYPVILLGFPCIAFIFLLFSLPLYGFLQGSLD